MATQEQADKLAADLRDAQGQSEDAHFTGSGGGYNHRDEPTQRFRVDFNLNITLSLEGLDLILATFGLDPEVIRKATRDLRRSSARLADSVSDAAPGA
jgi:hypothetical protein